MANEGEYEKVDGDILYSKDYREPNEFNLLNNIREQNGNTLQGFRQVTTVGSDNSLFLAGSYYPNFSGTDFNFTYDDHDGGDISNHWTSGGDGTHSLTESGTYLNLRAAGIGGSVWVSGIDNIFQSGGNHVNIHIGSQMFNGGGGGGDIATFYLKLDDTLIYTKAGPSAGIATTRYSNVQLFKESGNLYRARTQSSGGAFSNWSAATSYVNGNLIFALVSPAGVGTIGSVNIDYEKMLSGTRNTELIWSGTSANDNFKLRTDGTEPKNLFFDILGNKQLGSNANTSYEGKFKTSDSYVNISPYQWNTISTGSECFIKLSHSGTYGKYDLADDNTIGGLILKSGPTILTN